MKNTLYYTITNNCKKIIDIYNEHKFIIKPLIYIILIFTISIIAIIRADFNYIDDLERIAKGYKGWEDFSRFASSFLSTFLHASRYLTDISPLPQLLAVLFMAIASIIILYVYKDEKRFSFWDIVAVVPLALSPYFLECLSYKYDAPYMALSVLASVFPLLFSKKYKIYSGITILCTLLMCTTYQASSGIFLMFVILISLKKWNRGENFKEIIKFLILSILNYLVGLLIFKLFIMRAANNYVSNEMFSIKELIPGAFKNLYRYFSLVITDFKKSWLILIALMIISCIYVFTRESKRKKYISLPINIIALIMILILSFGIYPILTEPLFSPRAMYGFGVFITLMGVVIAESKEVYLTKIPVLALAWCFIVFSFTYGNAIKVQDEYTDFRVNLVIQDLNALDIFTKDKEIAVQISGTIGQSPILENMPQGYQMLNRLVPIQFGGDWYWSEYYFYNYFDLRNIKQDSHQDLKEYNLPIIKDTMYHTIKGNDEYVLIELK